jgi:hypothetical protein
MAEIQIVSPDCEDERGKRGKRGPQGATGPTGPAGSSVSRVELISPLSGTSSALPAGINAGGPQLNASQLWWVPVTSNLGDVITALTFEVFGNGVTNVAWGLVLFDYATNTSIPIAAGTVAAPPAAWTPTTPVFAPTTVAARQALIFFFEPNAGGSFAGLITATFA